MVRHVNYEITRGVPFERLIIVKNRRNRRMIKPVEARAALRTADGGVLPIQATITREWGIRLYMTAEETEDLPVGDVEWDVIAYLSAYSIQSPFYLNGGYNESPFSPLPEEHWRPIARGLITVKAFDTIASTGGATTMRLMYKQRTDVRRRFTWRDADGNVMAVDDAYLVAIAADNTVALQLRWFGVPPGEEAIRLLPGIERGYLAPAGPDSTLEMHISDLNTVAAGEYRFSLMVSALGDWEELASGTLAVEFSPASLAVLA